MIMKKQYSTDQDLGYVPMFMRNREIYPGDKTDNPYARGVMKPMTTSIEEPDSPYAKSALGHFHMFARNRNIYPRDERDNPFSMDIMRPMTANIDEEMNPYGRSRLGSFGLDRANLYHIGRSFRGRREPAMPPTKYGPWIKYKAKPATRVRYRHYQPFWSRSRISARPMLRGLGGVGDFWESAGGLLTAVTQTAGNIMVQKQQTSLTQAQAQLTAAEAQLQQSFKGGQSFISKNWPIILGGGGAVLLGAMYLKKRKKR